jgi:hypothetical protein
LRKFFEDRAIPFVWSKEIVQRDREARSASWDDYIGVKHGHPTTRYNELVSQEIKKSALRARPVQPLDNAAVE